MPRKIFIIACEPSGDAHGAHLIEALKKSEPDLEFRGLGGPRMQAAGAALLEDMTKISALGLGDVLRQYLTYRRIFYRALGEVWKFQPDAIILIDSPAFNLRFAKKIKKRIPVIYYISPQLWAWGGRRIHTVRRTVSKMLVILPFEKKLYDEAGVPCEFVGHPLLDAPGPSAPRDVLRQKLNLRETDIGVGLLPGSRASEVQRIFPLLLEAARLLKGRVPACRFFLLRSPNVSPAVYEKVQARQQLDLEIPETNLQDLMSAMDFGFVTSGTATLETTLTGTPFFLVYKASWTTYILGRQLIRVSFLGLSNLLAEKRIVPEFIQNELKPATLAHEAEILLKNPDLYASMKEEFGKIREILGQGGASIRAAKAILDFLK